MTLALLGAACGERYELGEVLQPIDTSTAFTSDVIAELVVDGPEDSDFELPSTGLPHQRPIDAVAAVGDVDGDGYDDWLTRFPTTPPTGVSREPAAGWTALRLVFGGPRSADALPEENLGLQFADAIGLSPEATAAGDVNGDGYADIFFVNAGAVSQSTLYSDSPWVSTLIEGPYLWYGGPTRTPDIVLLADVAVSLEEVVPKISVDGERVRQAGELVSVGDLDADGFDDFAFTPSVDSSRLFPAYRSDTTLLFYGASQRLRAGSIAHAAELKDTTQVRPLGDLDGDGFTELFVHQPDGGYMIPGTAERLDGAVWASDVGAPLHAVLAMGFDPPWSAVSPLGDLDADGYDDIIIHQHSATDNFFAAKSFLFYGSSDAANRPFYGDLADALFVNRGDARVSALGDWNGDGNDDLLLTQNIYREEGVAIEGGESWLPARGEMRVIAGGFERYSGVYQIPDLRSELELPSFGNTLSGFRTLGDIDADGFADVQFTLATPGWLKSYVKYGGPLSTVIQ